MATDDPFDWGAVATTLGLSHAPARPSDSVIGNGYPDGFPIPADQFNWIVHMLGRLTRMWGGYAYLHDAYDDMEDGEVALVIEDETQATFARFGYGYQYGDSTAETSIASLDATGKHYIVADDSADLAYIYTRGEDDATGTTAPSKLATCTPSNAGNLVRAVSDGERVLLAYGNYLECFNMSGVSQWVYSHGAVVRDCCLNGQYAFFVGAPGVPSGAEAGAVLLTAAGAAATTWDYVHNADLYSCCTNGAQFFVAGDASGSASLATMRAINADDGTDAANEGGNGISGEFWVWDLVGVEVTNTNQMLATDGIRLVVGLTSAAAHQVETRDCATGVQQQTAVLTGYSATSVAVDQDFVFVGTTDVGAPLDGFVSCFEKATLIEAWRRNQLVAGAVRPCSGVAVDGASVIAAFGSGANLQWMRLIRGNKATVFKRIDPNDNLNNVITLRGLMQPQGSR